MASKLTGKVKEVWDLVAKLQNAAKEYLQYRIQFATMVEQVIPKAQAKGKEQGYTPETAIKTARDLKTKRQNAVMWNAKFLDDLDGKLLELQTMLNAYDPAVMKKGPVTDPKKIEARKALKAMAISTVATAKQFSAEVGKMLRV